jgi:hypothetical protein
MKVKISKNKKTGIMNLKFSNVKTFKISNFSKILDLKKLEIVSNDNYSERLKLDVGDIDVTVNELINNKQVWSIFVFEPFDDPFNEEKIILYLSSKKTRVFIDINLADGMANFLINMNSYNMDVYQEMKNAIMHS